MSRYDGSVAVCTVSMSMRVNDQSWADRSEHFRAMADRPARPLRISMAGWGWGLGLGRECE